MATEQELETPSAEEIVMALDKHPELREAVHKLLGPRLLEGVWVTRRSTEAMLNPADRGGLPYPPHHNAYKVDVQFTVFDSNQLEPLLQLLHRYMGRV